MKVILFDGVCNLCNSAVNWIIDHDKKNKFHFSSLQSTYGKEIVARSGVQGAYMDTIILADGEKLFFRSTAILKILKDLGGFYALAYIFIIVPSVIRDFFYNIVARNRYRWFGKRNECRLPTPELKTRFLE